MLAYLAVLPKALVYELISITAAPAVQPNIQAAKLGFTLLEVLVVVLIIGILAGLAYSSFMDLILSNRAKENAQTMRAFAERAMMEAKRKSKDVEISLTDNEIKAEFIPTAADDPALFEPLNGGFKGVEEGDSPNIPSAKNASLVSFYGGAISKPQIGISGIEFDGNSEGYFLACGAKDYCAAAVKVNGKNSFIACVRRGANANWEEL